MTFRYINRARGGSQRPFDSDVLLWRTAVVANGGSVSLDSLVIVDQFIFTEKTNGTWTLTDDYLPLWAPDAASALTSLKQRRLAVAVNSPTFTANRDYTFNGTTNYIDTGFVPSTHAVAMTPGSVHLEVYERTNLTGGTPTALGTNSGSGRSLRIITRSSGTMLGGANSSAATFTLPSANSQGLTHAGRNGSLVTDVYAVKNGVDLAKTADPTSMGASLPADSLYIGAYNSTGTPANFRAASIGFAAWGAALNGSQRLARYNAVQAMATSLGAEV